MSAQAVRVSALLRVGLGVVCLAEPARVAVAARTRPDRDARAFVRVLGGRHLLQGAVTLALPVRAVARAGLAVDAVHALTLLALAAADPARRRGAVRNALGATAWSALDVAVATPGT